MVCSSQVEVGVELVDTAVVVVEEEVVANLVDMLLELHTVAEDENHPQTLR